MEANNHSGKLIAIYFYCFKYDKEKVLNMTKKKIMMLFDW
jgi:hypothetical protein